MPEQDTAVQLNESFRRTYNLSGKYNLVATYYSV